MTKKVFLILLITIIVAVGLILYLNPTTEPENGKLKVATTIYPLADIVKNVGGDQVEVVNLVPPGASPHTFEVTPSAIKQLLGVKEIFAIGGSLDAWTADILSAVGNTEIYTVNSGINQESFHFAHKNELEHEHEAEEHKAEEHEHEHHHNTGELDPHYWLSTINAKIIAANVADKLSALDPDNAAFYRSNLATYQSELNAAHDQIETILENLESRELIVFHESWNYFANEFDLEIVGVFVSSPGKEPTPQYLAELHETAIEHAVPAVFSEPQLSPEIIRPFVNDLDLELYILDPLGGIEERDSLINTLIYNAKIIKEALGS